MKEKKGARRKRGRRGRWTERENGVRIKETEQLIAIDCDGEDSNQDVVGGHLIVRFTLLVRRGGVEQRCHGDINHLDFLFSLFAAENLTGQSMDEITAIKINAHSIPSSSQFKIRRGKRIIELHSRTTKLGRIKIFHPAVASKIRSHKQKKIKTEIHFPAIHIIESRTRLQSSQHKSFSRRKNPGPGQLIGLTNGSQ